MLNEYNFPYTIRDLTEEENERGAFFPVEKVKLVGTRTCCPSRIKELGEELYNFKPRCDDIWLIGYPRSGTTLTQEILYLLGTDLNYEKAASELMDVRFPIFHDGLMIMDDETKTFQNGPLDEELTVLPHQKLNQSKEKRFIKSHFGFSMLHPEILNISCKVVFIARNPKDIIASLGRYPLFASLPGYEFRKVWNLLKYDMMPCTNYYEMLQEAWDRKDKKNLLILYYEEVNADKRAAVLKIANFLEKNITEDELETLFKHLDINSFKNNKSLNNDHLVNVGLYKKNDKIYFIRQGKSGGWRNDIPEEFVDNIDDEKF